MIAFPPIWAHAARSKRTQVTHLVRGATPAPHRRAGAGGCPSSLGNIASAQETGLQRTSRCLCHNNPEVADALLVLQNNPKRLELRPASFPSLCATLKKTIFLLRFVMA